MSDTQAERCSSCKTAVTNVSGTVKFLCPQCSKSEIVRCERCRRFAAKYNCASCGLEGPN
jgi:hypothetical protein